MTTAVCKWPATARRWTIAPAGNLPTDLTPLGGAQPLRGALANKLARIVWAMMARGEAYRRQPVAS